MIDLLIQAILLVPEHYYSIENPKRKNGQIVDYTNELVFPERNYCTNLYHQIILKIEDTIPNIGETYFLDEEIYKKFTGKYINNKLFKKTYNVLKCAKIGMRPDIILHRSQTSRDEKDQLLILECKIDPELSEIEFDKDFFKLNIYKSELKYQNAVYLIVNNSTEKIEKYISNYIGKYWRIENGRIEVLIITKYGEEIIRKSV